MKIDSNKSGSTVGHWVKKSLCAGIVMGLAMSANVSFAANNASDRSNTDDRSSAVTPAVPPAMTAFARIAKIPVVHNEDGSVNQVATYNKAKTVALDIARYIAHVDDSDDEGTDFPANWIVGGLEGGEKADDATINAAIMRIPSPNPIDPANTDLGVKKANVMDLCNAYYAKQALGVTPIIGAKTEDKADDKFVVNGYSHTPALPCELATWNDDEHIYVDMLDPNAIFTLFFTDVFVSEEMQDDAFVEAISALPPAVKGEIKTAVYNALDAAGYKYKATDQPMGPKYKDISEAFDAVASSPEVSPYKHVAYTKADGTAFGTGETKAVANAIIETMSIHGGTTADDRTAGQHVDELESILSAGSLWRSARHDPLGLPGKPEKNWVIEACSPKYAKMAMATGMHHATALPCEIAIQRVDRLDENGNPGTDGETESLVISYLDPNFMLGALFADMSDEEKEALGDVPGLILGDLQAIVQHALDNNGAELNAGNQFWYTMLP